MTKDEEKVLMLLQLKPWQRKLTVPSLAISTHGDTLRYHELLNMDNCDPGEVNAFTYTEERPEGYPDKIHRRQLFGVLNVAQFGTASQWHWSGVEHLADLLFGDPDWTVEPEPDGDYYNIGYQPKEMRNTDYVLPQKFSNN